MTKPKPLTDRYFRKVKMKDACARWSITIGGIGIIAVVIGMLVLIASVAMPLFFKSETRPVADVAAHESDLADVGLDDYLETGYRLGKDGVFRVFSIIDGKELNVRRVSAPDGAGNLVEVVPVGFQQYAYRYEGGAAQLVEFQFFPQFDENGTRSILNRIKTPSIWGKAKGDIRQTLIRKAEGEEMRVDLLGDGTIRLAQQEKEEDFLGNVTVTEVTGAIHPGYGNDVKVILDQNLRNLYVLGEGNKLQRWNVQKVKTPVLREELLLTEDGARVTALGLVLGDISLIVGDENGRLSTWMPVRANPDAKFRNLAKIHVLRAHDSAVQRVIPSRRDKSIFSVSDMGVVHGDHMTSEKALIEIVHDTKTVALAVNGRGSGLVVASPDASLGIHTVENPHPEISLRTLFGKVHYEDYDQAEYVWQSSSASDDYEPKISQVPLIFGTLKATFYAMLFAAPLAILGAIYSSQFLHQDWRRIVKPMVEIMAAVPSVVVGFLAGLWLAPILETRIPVVFLTVVMIPVLVVVALLIYERIYYLPGLKNLSRGFEFLGMIPVVILAVVAAVMLGSLVQSTLFEGDFRQFVFDEFRLHIDQRNSIVIAFGLGFAVIPIIFTIADDALSAVPRNLTAASLALGASRWQTAWRVVLPSASPGIFAALMIGLGRAVGETMIVLMATGNTPIMDFSIFNGMRTLSANIAVEMPEAPKDGTLFRSLYLSAVLLFLMTFVLNTAAEAIRIRLRKKYGNY